MPIRLVSPSLFVLHRSNPTSLDSIQSCTATRATGTVRDMRDDTLFLVEARILSQPRYFTQCQLNGPVYVVLSDHADLRAESFRISTFRSAALGVGIAAVVLPLLLLTLIYATWSGT